MEIPVKGGKPRLQGLVAHLRLGKQLDPQPRRGNIALRHIPHQPVQGGILLFVFSPQDQIRPLPVQKVLGDIQKNLVLGLVVVVQRPLGDPRRCGDIRQRNIRQRLGLQQPHGRLLYFFLDVIFSRCRHLRAPFAFLPELYHESAPLSIPRGSRRQGSAK